jgi:hypothetical protein
MTTTDRRFRLPSYRALQASQAHAKLLADSIEYFEKHNHARPDGTVKRDHASNGFTARACAQATTALLKSEPKVDDRTTIEVGGLVRVKPEHTERLKKYNTPTGSLKVAHIWSNTQNLLLVAPEVDIPTSMTFDEVAHFSRRHDGRTWQPYYFERVTE